VTQNSPVSYWIFEIFGGLGWVGVKLSGLIWGGVRDLATSRLPIRECVAPYWRVVIVCGLYLPQSLTSSI
jgi:hypothetical protein